jgi:membrane dipeptidase
VFVGQTPRTPENTERAKQIAMQKFEGIHRMAEQMYPDRIEIAYTPDDVERINKSGKLVAAIGIENGYVIGNDLALIKKYYDLGARYMTLAHTSNNDLCDSSTDPNGPEHHGISALGRQVVAEMNRVGMMVDISHVSKECMMQATALSRAPVIASHSSTRAFADVPRNMDDEQLLALKKNGGVMQTVALAGYVRVPSPEKQAAIAALRQELGMRGRGAGGQAGPSDSVRAVYAQRMAAIEAKWPGPSVKDFVDHIDHAVKLIGIDHVGISSDFDGGGGVKGWSDAAESLNVTIELVRRGYSEEDIRKLWGGNVLRVWRENERIAKTLM